MEKSRWPFSDFNLEDLLRWSLIVFLFRFFLGDYLKSNVVYIVGGIAGAIMLLFILFFGLFVLVQIGLLLYELSLKIVRKLTPKNKK